MNLTLAARRLPWVVAVIAAVLFLSLSLHLPLSLFTIAGHDDALFWRLADAIVNTGWLGAYDQMTLAKGPGFSLLLALNHVLGTPITLLLALIQLGCASVLVRELRAWGMPRLLALVTWLVVVFQPAALPSRVIRDFWYQALTVVVLAGLLFVVRRSHRGQPSVAAAAFGVCAGVLWITREEGVWVLPTALLLLIGAVWMRRQDRAGLSRLVARAAAFGGACALTVALVATVNFWHYGTFSVVDLKRAPFVQALRMLNSIQTPDAVAYVPVNRQQRRLAYTVSPAFRELQGYLDGEYGGELHWRKHGCALYPQTCGDFAGGWFLWAVRDAAAAAGHFASAARADRFFGRVAEEIDDACRAGRVTCSTQDLPFVPNMTPDAWDRFLPAIGRALSVSLYGEGLEAIRAPSHGPPDRFMAFREFLGWPRVVPIEQGLTISGWFVSPRGQWIELACGRGDQVRIRDIARQPSPDLVQALQMPDQTQSRFSFDVDAIADSECVLRAIGADSALTRLGDLRAKSGKDFVDGSRGYIDAVSGGRQKSVSMQLAQFVAAGYAALVPGLMGVGLAMGAWGGITCLCKRQGSPLLGVGLICWMLAATRVGLLALVDATSFPGVTMPYLAPATQLWAVGALCWLALPFAASHPARPGRLASTTGVSR